MKILKYIVSALVVVAFLLEANVIRISYNFLNVIKAQSSVPPSEGVFLMVLIGVTLLPLIYMANFVASFILILKNKITGYLISGIISIVVFADGVQELLRSNASITVIVVVTSIFWAAMVVLPFWAYFKFKKETIAKNLTE
jgi:hypothetical protein